MGFIAGGAKIHSTQTRVQIQIIDVWSSFVFSKARPQTSWGSEHAAPLSFVVTNTGLGG